MIRSSEYYPKGNHINELFMGKKSLGHACPSGLFYLHIPKTGGTTIEDSICSRNIRYPTSTEAETALGIGHCGGAGDSNKRCEHLFLNEYTPDAKRTFSTIRDPYERFVSEANYRKMNSLDELIYECNSVSRKQHSDLYAHCSPQTSFVGKNGELVDDLFLTENIDKELPEYLSRWGEGSLSKHQQVSQKRFTVDDLLPHHRKWIENKYASDFSLVRSLSEKNES